MKGMRTLPTFPLISQLLLLFGLMLVFMVFSALVGQWIGSVTGCSQRTVLLLTSVVQSLSAFIFPAVVIGWLSPKKWYDYLHLTTLPTWRSVGGILIVFVIGFPLLNQIIYWNSMLSFPDSLKSVENTFREWEAANGAAGETILSGTSLPEVLSSILIIGLLTGISEEMFFRGALQTTLRIGGVNKIAAIWTAAFIFSAMHFQFFGFVPRMLIGALFGYYLFWSGSLWESAIAHAVNNSSVVIVSWLSTLGINSEQIDMAGVAVEGFPWWAFGSAMLLALFFIFGQRVFFVSQKR